jgi:hypothetical protein
VKEGKRKKKGEEEGTMNRIKMGIGKKYNEDKNARIEYKK